MTISSTATKPSRTDATITDPAPGAAAHVRPVRSLLRLLPFARPALAALIGSAITAAVAMFCGLAFPLVIRQIIDGPITDRDMAALWPLAGLLLGLGIVEAALFLGAADALRAADDAGRGDDADGHLRPPAGIAGRIP